MLSNTRGKDFFFHYTFIFFHLPKSPQSLLLSFSPHTWFCLYTTHSNCNYWDILFVGQMKGPVDWRGRFWEVEIKLPVLSFHQVLQLPDPPWGYETWMLGLSAFECQSPRENSQLCASKTFWGWRGVDGDLCPSCPLSLCRNPEASTTARTRMQEIFVLASGQ